MATQLTLSKQDQRQLSPSQNRSKPQTKQPRKR